MTLTPGIGLLIHLNFLKNNAKMERIYIELAQFINVHNFCALYQKTRKHSHFQRAFQSNYAPVNFNHKAFFSLSLLSPEIPTSAEISVHIIHIKPFATANYHGLTGIFVKTKRIVRIFYHFLALVFYLAKSLLQKGLKKIEICI